jgi:superfamily II DNA or RNA helicase
MKEITAIVSGRLIVSSQDIPDGLRKELFDLLTWDNPDYRDAKIRRKPTTDYQGNILIPKYVRTIKEVNGKIYIAREFWPEFDRLCEQYGIKVKFVDRRVLHKPKPLSDKIELWKPQKKAFNDLIDEARGHQGILKAPCGSGKTIIMLKLAAALGQNTLVLAHTNDLLNQWKDYCKKFLDYEPGWIQGNKIELKQITLASVMTLAQRELTKEFLQKWGMIILDEAHHTPATSFRQIMNSFPAYYRFGVTATPGRSDKLEGMLFAVCGPVIAEINYDVLEKSGLILRPTVIPIETNWRFPYRGMRTWHRMVKALISNNRRNTLIVKNIINQYNGGNHVQLVLSKQIDHITQLQSILKKHAPNIRSTLLLAGGIKKDRKGNVIRNIRMTKQERKNAIKKARKANVDVIFGTTLADEGLDIKRLDRLHLTFPTRAESKIEQQVGRIQRVHPKKKDVIVFDYVDQTTILRDQWYDRRDTYKALGLNVVRGNNVSN